MFLVPFLVVLSRRVLLSRLLLLLMAVGMLMLSLRCTVLLMLPLTLTSMMRWMS